MEDNSERAALRSKIHNADVDVNYAIYYPLLRPYVSLFPNTKKDKDKPTESAGDVSAEIQQSSESIDGPKGDLETWKAVEEAMEAGTLDRLRNSKEGIVMPGSKVQTQKGAKGNKVQKDQREQKVQPAKIVTPKVDDEGSDGGFFDE